MIDAGFKDNKNQKTERRDSLNRDEVRGGRGTGKKGEAKTV